MTGELRVPDDLGELDAALARVRFSPRASLGPELLGRLRRGESPRPSRLRRRLGSAWAVAASLVVVTLGAAWLTRSSGDITVDRCCYDLDGGGVPDDGAVVIVRPGEDVRRIAIYEDLDGSRSFTSSDLLRFDQGPTLAVPAPSGNGLVTLRECCTDYDGEGPDDDGLVVVAVPPDRVMMVALYEHATGSVSAPEPPH